MAVQISPAIKDAVRKLMAHEGIKKALAYLEANQQARIDELKEMTLLHGAPFKEGELRSPMFVKKLEAYGCTECATDTNDNAFGTIKGSGQGSRQGSRKPPTVLLEAHLDTVFPAETPLAVREEGTRIYCPGVGDDTAGLATVLSVCRAIRHAGLKPVHDILLAGTSGEEGEGDLRGIKGLLRDHPEIGAHLALEPWPFGYFTKDGVGSRRYEVIFRGPGGHSFLAFGLPSPLHAMGRAIAKMAETRTPASPKTTYTVGVVSGGTSVNSIAFEGRMKIDMRSTSQEELLALEKKVLAFMREAAEEETAFWRAGGEKITVECVRIGDRAAGSQPGSSPIVQAAFAAAEALDVSPRLTDPSSTNSNASIGLGIPSLVVRTGGDTGNTHNLEEWFDTKGAEKGDMGALLMLFLLAGLDGVTAPVPLK